MAKHNIEYPEELQTLLENLLESKNVYYQPPSDKRLNYPCIIYNLDYIDTTYADSRPFYNAKRYSITYIDKIPDQYIPDRLMSLPGVRFDRAYVSDNLHHTVVRLYFDAKPNNLKIEEEE